MDQQTKKQLSKLIEYYRIKRYQTTANSLYSKTKFGYILIDGTLKSICSFHTYQKILVNPEQVRESIYVDLIYKLGYKYNYNSFIYSYIAQSLYRQLYQKILYYQLDHLPIIIDTIKNMLSSSYIIESEFLSLLSLIEEYYFVEKPDLKEKILSLLELSYLFPDDLKIILYDIAYRYTYTNLSDIKLCTNIIHQIQVSDIDSVLLDIDILKYSIYLGKVTNHLQSINQLKNRLSKVKNYPRLLEIYPLLLHYAHINSEDDTPIYNEVLEIINTQEIHPKNKRAWLTNCIIHAYDNNDNQKVVELFEEHFLNIKSPLIAIILYYSACSYLNHSFHLIEDQQVCDYNPSEDYDVKHYFETNDISSKAREETLLSFYTWIKQNDSIFNRLIYIEFTKYSDTFSKNALLKFINEMKSRVI